MQSCVAIFYYRQSPLGTTSQSEILQLKLGVLTAQRQYTQDSIDYVLAKQQFRRYLNHQHDVEIQDVSSHVTHFFDLNIQEVMKFAFKNNKEVLNFRLQRIEAEKALALAKSSNSLSFNIYANLGLSNSAPTIPHLYNRMENQQNIILSFSVPLIDWGYGQTIRRRAEADLSMVESQVEQKTMQIEQEVALHASRWNLHQQQLLISEEARKISEQNFDLELERFLRGNTSLNDLNVARNQRDAAVISHIEAQKTYWQLYYVIRKLTLFDFQKGEEIKFYD